MSPYQFSFNWIFICFFPGLLKESTQLEFHSALCHPFSLHSVSYKDTRVLYGMQTKTFTYFQGHSIQQQHTNNYSRNFLLKPLPVLALVLFLFPPAKQMTHVNIPVHSYLVPVISH